MKKNVLVFFRRDGESHVFSIMKCALGNLSPKLASKVFFEWLKTLGRRMQNVNFIQLYCIVFSVT